MAEPNAAPPPTATAAQRLRWRAATVVLTWVAYAGLYLTRYNYTIALPGVRDEFGWSKTDLGMVATVYLTVYAAGQFINGPLTDRFGPRKMLTIAFVLSGTLSAAMGLSGTILAFATFYGLNGYAQSMGWPAATKALANWFTTKERGRILGVWGTCYPAGSAISKGLAAFILGYLGWRACLIIPGLMAIGLAALMYFMLRDHPEDRGLEPIEEAEPLVPSVDDAGEPQKESLLRHFISAVSSPKIVILGLAYFCIKYVRYTFVFWLGLYLVDVLKFDAQAAGYAQTPLDLAGMAGSVFAGWASDQYFGAKRAPLAVLMLIGLFLSLIAFLFVPSSATAVAAVVAVIGFLLFGPDMLVSAAAAMDLADSKQTATVIGFVNGVGAIGAALSGVVNGVLAEQDWNYVFYVLIGMVAIASAITSLLWKQGGQR